MSIIFVRLSVRCSFDLDQISRHCSLGSDDPAVLTYPLLVSLQAPLDLWFYCSGLDYSLPAQKRMMHTRLLGRTAVYSFMQMTPCILRRMGNAENEPIYQLFICGSLVS